MARFIVNGKPVQVDVEPGSIPPAGMEQPVINRCDPSANFFQLVTPAPWPRPETQPSHGSIE